MSEYGKEDDTIVGGISKELDSELEDLCGTDLRSNSAAGWIAAFEIAAKHYPTGKYLPLNAEHDILYMPMTLEQVPRDSEDGRTLNALGFHVDDNGEGWARFV